MRSLVFHKVLFALGILAHLLFAKAAVAQMGPAARYVYGGWGANSSYNTSRQIGAQQHAAAARRGFEGTRYVQDTIRSAMSSSGRGVGQDAGQSARDWLHQRQAPVRYVPSYSPAPVASGVSPSSFAASTLQQTPAARSDDLVKWPARLRDPRFAEQRAVVEAPYRKQDPEGSGPTVGDYEKMVDATAQMKLILKGMAYQLSAGEYLEVEKFLDALAAEARERAKRKAEAPPAVEPAEQPATSGAADK